MKQNRLFLVLFILVTALSLVYASFVLANEPTTKKTVKAQLQQDDEITKALVSEQTSPQPQGPIYANLGGGIGQLFVGVDDVAIDAYTIDVTTNDFYTAFNGVEVWGAAYDPVGDRVFFNNGSVLWEWPVGGTPTSLGTMTIGGAAASMVGLAYYNGTLYASRNIGTEDIYAVDTTTLAATVAITLTPPTASRDLGGIDIDPATGQLYGTNDAAALRGLVEIDPDGTVTVIAPYPTGQTDIDGLAVGGGNAYLITDEPGFVYVFNLTTMTYTTPLTNPWTTAEVFSAGAWLGSETGPNINLAKTVGTDPGICAAGDDISVEFGTAVTYCYRIFNTGDVTFTLHDLDDSELGNILTGFNYLLAPGANAFLTETLVITQTTVNTATWTAYNAGPTDVVSATDSARVTIFFAPQIETSPSTLSSTQAPDNQVSQTLTISNIGTGDLNWSIATETINIAKLPQPAVISSSTQPESTVEFVNSPEQCASYKNYAGAEPQGYAKHCLGGEAVLSANGVRNFDPTDMGFAHDIRNTDNLVEFVLNDFPGQVATSQNTQSIFGYDFDSTATILYALDNDAQQLGTVDRSTGVFTLIGSSVPNVGHTWTGLTINPLNNTFYASSTDGTVSTLYTLNAATGAATIVGDITGIGLVIDIAMNTAGALYAHDIGTDAIYQIDPSNGTPTLIGLTGYNANFAQGMDFDNTDGTLYIFLYIGGGANVYGTVNLATGAVTPLAVDNPLGEFEGATITTYPCLGDLPWASVTPNSGTTSGGSASDVTVTFDSTGLSTGVYTGTLCIESNDASSPLMTVPLTLTVEDPAYSVELASDGAITDLAGATVTYTLSITNTGNTADTFNLAVTGNSWMTMLSDSSVSLNIGESTMVWVTVEIPTGVADGDMDVAMVTATSVGDNSVSDSVTLTTTAEVKGYFIYLPFVARSDS